MADSRAQDYAAKLDQLLADAKQLTPEAEKSVRTLLEQMSREVLSDIVRTDPASYTAARLKALKAQIDRLTAEFGRQAAARIGAIQQKAYAETCVAVDATVAAGTGAVMIHPVIDRQALAIVQGYTADLITGVSQQAGTQINAAIQRAYMGGASLTDLVKQIGTALADGEFTGLFSQIGERASMIAMNETMRVHSLASQARMTDLVTRTPELRKEWMHIPAARVPRLTHMLANGQTQKVEEPFHVGGEDLMYPRDPSGSPENTINCHCISRPWLPPEILKPTDQERALLKAHGISVSIAH
jgi:uncharacterized protein with gpF-like domain